MYQERVITNQAPERQLWCAVIGRAVQDAMGHVGAMAGSAARHRAREEARSWFVENGGGFRDACDAAGYDPDFLRRHVLRLIAQDLADACTAGAGPQPGPPACATRRHPDLGKVAAEMEVG